MRKIASLTVAAVCLFAATTFAQAQDRLQPALVLDLGALGLKNTVDDYVDSAAYLLAEMYADSAEPNLAASPLGSAQIGAALATIGSGKTKKELYELFHVDPEVAEPALPYVRTTETNFAKLNKFIENGFGAENFKTYSAFLAKESMKNSTIANIVKNYAMAVEVCNFGDAQVNRLNRNVENITGFKDVIPSDPRQVFIAVNASNVTAIWENQMSEGGMDFDGESVTAIRGKISYYYPCVANDKYETYEVPMKNAKAFFILANSKRELKKFAEDMSQNGLSMTSAAGSKKGPAKLAVPQITFGNDIDYRKFAQSKGLKTPFGNDADFSEGFQGGRGIFCSDLKTKSSLTISKGGINLKQVTFAIGGEKGFGPFDPEKLPELNIDKPFCLIVTDNEGLGCATIVAFVSEVN